MHCTVYNNCYSQFATCAAKVGRRRDGCGGGNNGKSVYRMYWFHGGDIANFPLAYL